jgi:hypothetical protein
MHPHADWFVYQYEREGGRQSQLWREGYPEYDPWFEGDPKGLLSATNVPHPPEPILASLEQWRSTTRAITREELVGTRWVKVGDHGYAFIVEFRPDDTFLEIRIVPPGAARVIGSWRLDNGILHTRVESAGRTFHLTVIGKEKLSVHSGVEFESGQLDKPTAYFRLLRTI